MKVLYIGYYREDSDWGRQTVNNILALEKAGVDVVCKCISLNEGTRTPDALVHLEKKDHSDATHCIQHVFPEHLIGTGKFVKNVALLTNNFIEIEHSSWVEKLDMMDEIWVQSETAYSAFSNHLMKKIKYVPLAIDHKVYNKRYNDLSIKEAEGTFKFYTFASVGDAIGLNWILSTFHSEFDATDNVSLVIYMKPNSPDGQQELKFAEELSNEVKSLLRLESSPSNYIKDIIIATQTLTRDNTFELHQYCDCYVSCNANASFPLAEMDAVGFGNTPIVSSNSAINEYADNSVRAVNSIYQVVQSKGGMFGGTNNGKDYWIRPDEYAMKRWMRLAYTDWSADEFAKDMVDKREAQKEILEFSLEKVGKKMEDALSV